jgi:hypothetical protein
MKLDKIMLVITYTLMLAAIGYFITAIFILSGGWAIGGLILVIALVFWNDARKGKI